MCLVVHFLLSCYLANEERADGFTSNVCLLSCWKSVLWLVDCKEANLDSFQDLLLCFSTATKVGMIG